MGQVNENTDLVCFKTEGSCMSPEIEDGDLLLVRLFHPDKIIRKRNIIVYRLKYQNIKFAHWFIGRIQCGNSIKYITGNNYLGIKPAKISENQIIGEVVALIKCSKLKWRIFTRMNRRFYFMGKFNKMLRLLRSKLKDGKIH